MSLPDHAPTRLSDIDWRWALPRIAAVFVLTRLLVLVVAVVAEATQTVPAGLIRIDDRPILSSLTLWDGEFYVGIAGDGYHADPSYGPDYAFYPGFPILVRAVSLLTFGDMAIAAVIAANVAFAMALVALYALSVQYLTRERAILSLWFLALAPGAIAFSLTYTEPLFLLLAVCAFLAAERGRFGWAGVFVALATITRAQGILLLLPLLAMIISREGWQPSRKWLSLAIAPALLALFFAWLWWLTGDPMAPVSAQAYWNPPAESDVVTGAAATSAPAVTPEVDVPEHRMDVASGAVIAIWVGSLAFYSFLFVFFRHDRIRPAYWLLAILAVVSVFMTGRLQSAPRYLAVAWPFDWVLASRRSRLGQAIVLGVFAVVHVVLLWMAFTWRIPP